LGNWTIGKLRGIAGPSLVSAGLVHRSLGPARPKNENPHVQRISLARSAAAHRRPRRVCGHGWRDLTARPDMIHPAGPMRSVKAPPLTRRYR
jgi:hypothetical protein